MTAFGVEDRLRCGARVRRCRVCENTVGRNEDFCRKCRRTGLDGLDIDDESTCLNTPLTGTSRCRKHGGKSPQVRAKVAAQELDDELRAEFARLGEPPPVDDVLQGLLDVAAERRAWLATIRRLLPELESLSTTDSFNVQRVRAVVALYTEALDDNQRSLEGLARLNIAERQVRADEAEVAVLVGAVDLMLSKAVPGELHHRCRLVLGEALRAADEGRPVSLPELPPVPSLAGPQRLSESRPVTPDSAAVAPADVGMGAGSPDRSGGATEASSPDTPDGPGDTSDRQTVRVHGSPRVPEVHGSPRVPDDGPVGGSHPNRGPKAPEGSYLSIKDFRDWRR